MSSLPSQQGNEFALHFFSIDIPDSEYVTIVSSFESIKIGDRTAFTGSLCVGRIMVRIPKYLREDFPAFSLQQTDDKVARLALGLENDLLKSYMETDPKPKKRRSKKRNRKLGKTKTQPQPRPDLLLNFLNSVVDAKIETEQLTISDKPPQLDSRQESSDQCELNIKIPETISVETFQFSVLASKCTSGASKRIRDKIQDLQRNHMVEDFLHDAETTKRAKDKLDREIFLSEKVLKPTPSHVQLIRMGTVHFVNHTKERQTSFLLKSAGAVVTARARRKERDERNCKLQQESEQKTREDQLQKERMSALKELWCRHVFGIKYASKVKNAAQSVMLQRDKTRAARVIQRGFRKQLQLTKSREQARSFNLLSRVMLSFVYWRRKRRKVWAASQVVQFLMEYRMNFGKIMAGFRYRVIKCQRYIRQQIACTDARVDALSVIWSQQERVYAQKKKQKHLRLLQNNAHALMKQSDAITNPHVHKMLAAKRLRKLDVPLLSNGKRVADLNCKDDKLYFPGGCTQKHLSRSLGSDAEYVMDMFLNDVVTTEMESLKEQPLVVEHANVSVRITSLKYLIQNIRRKHRVRLKHLKHEREVKESQRVKLGVEEAKWLLQNENISIVTRNMCSETARIPVMLLYSTVRSRDIYGLVYNAHEGKRYSGVTIEIPME